MEFQRLLPEHYPELERYFTTQSHKLCYYSLSSLIAWCHHVSYSQWRIVDNDLIISVVFPDNPQKNWLLMPIPGEKPLPPAGLKDLATSLNHDKFVYVPEDYITSREPGEIEEFFEIKELKEFEDYVFRTEDIANLKGKKYSKKRNLINQFLKNHVDRGAVSIDKITRNDIPECIEHLDRWCDTRSFDYEIDDYASTEKAAVLNALNNIDRLGFSGILLRLDGNVAAFGIGSQLTNEIGGFNFEKAVPDIKGLYQYFDMMCARHLFKDYSYINKECDMGLPGLAQSKRSYYPAMTVKAYSLTLK